MMITSKLILLLALYISQYLPTTFFIQTVPVLMRQQNMSLGEIGFLGLLVIPSALKFLWSPLVDRYRLPGLGHYRGWIIFFQSLLLVTVLVTATLNVQTNILGLVVCMFLTFLFCASQDIATDALAVNLLTPEERGIGNSIQASGNFLGAIIGGGAALILLEKIGFFNTLVMMAIVLLLCAVPILLYQEPNLPPVTDSLKSYFQPFLHFFSRPGIWLWLLVILLYMISENVSGTLIRPLLVDRGLSLSDIGWLLGIASYIARIVAALIAGVLITRWGRKRSLIGFGIIANLAALLYILPAAGVAYPPILYTVCMLVSGLQSMAYTALLTAMMDRSNPATAGTDYTTQVSAIFVGVVATTVLGGVVADAIGYGLTIFLAAVISLISVGLLPRVYRQPVQI